MTYYVIQPYTREQFEFSDLTEAVAKKAEFKSLILEKEDYRFTIAKEVVDGNNTTWMNADLDNDPEDHNYHVFNQDIGQHELFTSLSAAKARRLELKEKFAEELGLNDAPLEKPLFVQPISKGSQTL